MSGDGAPVVEMPTNGVDGRVALATAVHAAPGVYAALVGSGMSSAAGIPTGWQVVQDLIRKVALAEGIDASDVENRPEEWWAAQGRPEPRYDTLLPGLATTDAARQALLRRYFELLTDGTQVQPTAGHHALAALAATGRARVILDLERVGVRGPEENSLVPALRSVDLERVGGPTSRICDSL
ncbi:MAG: hypothetical protein ABSD78_17670 [Acidimicrobiales bacterium]|jgi:hypothetical protein